jgi:hypothetical protein
MGVSPVRAWCTNDVAIDVRRRERRSRDGRWPAGGTPALRAELEKPVKMFGTQTTERGVLLTTISHLHEHLGQSIAYARTNGVAPPWSR